MSQVAITGWTKGCNTVSAIKELREKTPMRLNEAHVLVNRVLGNERVVVCVSSPAAAKRLADSLNSIGLLAVSLDVERIEIATGR
jgi:hypothetical protein